MSAEIKPQSLDDLLFGDPPMEISMPVPVSAQVKVLDPQRIIPENQVAVSPRLRINTLVKSTLSISFNIDESDQTRARRILAEKADIFKDLAMAVATKAMQDMDGCGGRKQVGTEVLSLTRQSLPETGKIKFNELPFDKNDSGTCSKCKKAEIECKCEH